MNTKLNSLEATECLAPTHYQAGASVEPVIEDGFGYYLYIKYTGLSPKHASAVAAVMVNERLLEYRGTKPIELRRVV